jgi:hypothetical protein
MGAELNTAEAEEKSKLEQTSRGLINRRDAKNAEKKREEGPSW